MRGKRLFRIRWKGFKEADDTWEPEATLSCPDIVKKYLDAVSQLNLKYFGFNKTTKFFPIFFCPFLLASR